MQGRDFFVGSHVGNGYKFSIQEIISYKRKPFAAYDVSIFKVTHPQFDLSTLEFNAVITCHSLHLSPVLHDISS